MTQEAAPPLPGKLWSPAQRFGRFLDCFLSLNSLGRCQPRNKGVSIQRVSERELGGGERKETTSGRAEGVKV